MVGILDRTLTFLPGIGAARANRLRSLGLGTWDALEAALVAGRSRRDLLGSGTHSPAAKGLQPSAQVSGWRSLLEAARRALAAADPAWFLERLDAADHWRVLAEFFDRACFLDIETTGLSRHYGHPTVVGMLRGREFRHWVWPEPLDEVRAWIAEADLLVTFNGRSFDLPFLAHHVPGYDPPLSHVDLRDVARAAGLRGGLKALEAGLGLVRPDEVQGIAGHQAVGLWHRARAGDAAAFHCLLAYNRADVEMLPEVARRLLERLHQKHSDTLPPPDRSPPGPTLTLGEPRDHAALLPRIEAASPSVPRLVAEVAARLGRDPVVVGIDLRADSGRPTGWARLSGRSLTTCTVHKDLDILALTRAAAPDVVAIDAPLSLPRGHPQGPRTREAERVLASRRVPAYPPLMPGMRGLTERGMRLATELGAHGLRVLECFPGAAQDALGLPRKQDDLDALAIGLRRLGFRLRGPKTHDELDAVTAALVGLFFLAERYEAVGDPDEGVVIVPRPPPAEA